MFEQEGWIGWPPDLQEVNLFFHDFYILIKAMHVNTLWSCFNLQITPFNVYVYYLKHRQTALFKAV